MIRHSATIPSAVPSRVPGLVPSIVPGAAATASTPLLLDTYTGAAAAFSLRKLRTAYSGSAIRVRRSSDNAEADIGFSGNDLDTTSLLSHCGAGNGFVVTWYDQSGNGNDATQATTTAQPRIVNSGAVDTVNGKPAVVSLDAGDLLASGTLNLSQPTTYFITCDAAADGTERRLVSDGSNGNLIRKMTTDKWNIFAGTNLTAADAFASGQKVLSVLFDGASSYVRENGAGAASGNAGATGLVSAGLMGNGGATWHPNSAQEFIIYESDQTDNQAAIETDINDYYSVF